jgi:ribulose bisphosphate carboxylase small subunit
MLNDDAPLGQCSWRGAGLHWRLTNEIVMNTRLDPKIVAQVRSLLSQGYRIGTEQVVPLLNRATMAKCYPP